MAFCQFELLQINQFEKEESAVKISKSEFLSYKIILKDNKTKILLSG